MSNKIIGTIPDDKNINVTITSGARGKSAYESWLDQGNTGTEADFVQALLQDETFVYRQTTNSDTWTINHNLEKYPSVTIVTETTNEVMFGEVTYIDNNNLEVKFKKRSIPYAIKGKAYLN